MARKSRRTRASLTADLQDRPGAYDLFQAIRLSERIAALEWRARGFGAPDPVGWGVDPGRAGVRLLSSVDLGFAAGEVTRIEPGLGTPTRITQGVVGLVGTSGPLPLAFTEMVQSSVRDRDPGLKDFLDLFSNRLAGLLYDAFAKYRIVIETERKPLTGRAAIDDVLRSVIGIATPALVGRLGIPDAAAIHYAGLLGRHARSAHAVERTLSSALQGRIRVEQFVGEWLPIARSERTRLPTPAVREGSFAKLGQDAVVGTRTWSVQGRVRLLIGPLSYAAFSSHLPGGAGEKRLASLASFAIGPDMAYVQRLVLHAAEVPALRVGGPRDAPGASRLGWNTWLASTGPRRDDGTVDIPGRTTL